jgi:hypothetical protein
MCARRCWIRASAHAHPILVRASASTARPQSSLSRLCARGCCCGMSLAGRCIIRVDCAPVFISLWWRRAAHALTCPFSIYAHMQFMAKCCRCNRRPLLKAAVCMHLVAFVLRSVLASRLLLQPLVRLWLGAPCKFTSFCGHRSGCLVPRLHILLHAWLKVACVSAPPPIDEICTSTLRGRHPSRA